MYINENYKESVYHIITTSSAGCIYVMLYNLQSALKSMDSQKDKLVKYIYLTNGHINEAQSASHNVESNVLILQFFTYSKLSYYQQFSTNCPHVAVLLKEFFMLTNKSACLSLITHYFTEVPIIMP